jgi:cyclase
MPTKAICMAIAVFAGQSVYAQGSVSIEDRIAADGIAAEELRDGHYLFYLTGGGNMIASIGDQGVLVVDDNFVPAVPIYQEKIRELGGGDIDFVVNTHWHFDHADGNQVLGPQGTWMVSHANSRDMMTRANVINLVVSPSVNQAPYPTAALPVATYDDTMQLHFNGERIDLRHFGPAHTTGDTAVIFRDANIVHLGDVFNTSGYPFIDAGNGGTIDGIIQFCEAVLMEIDADTFVVPGHGRVSDYAGLREYVSILTTVRDRISSLIDRGATLDEVIAAKPTAEWDARLGDSQRFVDRAYTSLSR